MQESHIAASDVDEKGAREGPKEADGCESGETDDRSSSVSQTLRNGDIGGDAERVRRLRLHEFLRELVREEGRMEAAELLGVNYKTLVRAVESGRLSSRMNDALERLLLSGQSPGGDERDGRVEELGQRLARLERGLESFVEELRGGLAELRGTGAGQAGDAAVGHAATQVPTGGREVVDQLGTVIGLRPVKRAEPSTLAPEVVTEGPAVGDEEAYAEAWPLVEDWRRLRAGHPTEGKGLSWLVAEEELLTLELAMLEEHGLTLPPETEPLRGFGRASQVNWRRTALEDTRRARVWAGVWRGVRRALVVGLLLGVSAGTALLDGCAATASLA